MANQSCARPPCGFAIDPYVNLLPDSGYQSGDHENTDPADLQDAWNVYQVALPIVFGLIILLGIVGNFMVIYVISARRKLRTVTNFLLLNLAITDVAFLALCGPFTVIHYALMVWPLGDEFCRVVQYLMYVTCYVTVYTLVTIAIIRYLLVVKGGSPACVHSGRYILFIIAGIWAASLLINIPVPLTFGLNEDPVSNRTECVISCQVKGQQFFATFFVFAYALPLAIIATLYGLLIRHLRLEQQSSMIRKQARSFESQESNAQPKRSVSKSTKSTHVTRVLVLVVAVFAVCWLPLHVHALWGTFGALPQSFSYKMILIVFHALVFLNSALNPLIYNFFSSEFRESFKNIFTSEFSRDGSINSGSGSKGFLIK